MGRVNIAENFRLPDVIEIALGAGNIIQRYYSRGDIASKEKPDRSPITDADLEANSYIVQSLQKIAARIPIITEESQLPDYEVRRTRRKFWLVDPLDGTKEFIKGTGDFTVNIALIEDSEPVMGVIYAPATKCLYYAEKGSGAWKAKDNCDPVSIYKDDGITRDSLRVAESRSHPSKELEAYLGTLPIGERIAIGSSLKFCWIAEGKADLYPRFGPTMEWDTAAGDCIYRNCGRSGLRPSPLTYNKPDLRNANFVIGLETEALSEPLEGRR